MTFEQKQELCRFVLRTTGSSSLVFRKLKQNKLEQNKLEQNKLEQNKLEQNKLEQNKLLSEGSNRHWVCCSLLIDTRSFPQ